jgi:hypothetical protein
MCKADDVARSFRADCRQGFERAVAAESVIDDRRWTGVAGRVARRVNARILQL